MKPRALMASIRVSIPVGIPIAIPLERQRFLPFALTCASLACGSSSASSAVAQSPAEHGGASEQASDPPALAASAEVGALDEREAEQSFRDSLDGLQACISDGIRRFDFISGDIELAVKIDATRRAREVWAPQSTLGERLTEKCMFDALRAVTWPAPVGGSYGIARNSFEFEPRKGTPTPAVWDAGRVAGTVEALTPLIEECRASAPGSLLVTLYIGDDGRAVTGGAASREPMDEDAIDCVVNALLAAEYPAPESSPTKVRFQL